MTDIFLVLAGYLFGSISTAIVVCRLMGLPDPRSQGSRNPGTTNVLRIGGKKAAILTLAGDMLKGLLPVLVAHALDAGAVGRLFVVKGRPAEVVTDWSRKRKADLIVMGTLGRAGIPGLFIGNTAEEVLQSTCASILAVKPAGGTGPAAAAPVARLRQSGRGGAGPR